MPVIHHQQRKRYVAPIENKLHALIVTLIYRKPQDSATIIIQEIDMKYMLLQLTLIFQLLCVGIDEIFYIF